MTLPIHSVIKNIDTCFIRGRPAQCHSAPFHKAASQFLLKQHSFLEHADHVGTVGNWVMLRVIFFNDYSDLVFTT